MLGDGIDMDSGNIALIGLGLQAGGLLVGAVWCVGRMRSSVELLSASLGSVERTLRRVESAVDLIDGRVDKHAERIAVLETRGEQP